MNIHNYLQNNGLEQLKNDNNRIDTDMDETLKNVDVSSVIGLINSHTPPQDNESSRLNEINIRVDNGDVNDDYFNMNGYTGYGIKTRIPLIIQRKEMKFLPTDT